MTFLYAENSTSRHVLDVHYKRLAHNYEEYLVYSSDFMRKHAEKMVQKLALEPFDQFADLGGGTGMFSVEINRLVKFSIPTWCVDPCEAMLSQIPLESNIQPVCMGANEFLLSHMGYTKILIKESIHHIKDRIRLFREIFDGIPSGGRVLLVHVPPEINYPLFAKALQKARHWHAPPNVLFLELQGAGFRVERDYLDYHHDMPKERYFEQVEARFMSVLSTFTDEEMKQGMAEMRETYKNHERLSFIDHFDYLTATKP